MPKLFPNNPRKITLIHLLFTLIYSEIRELWVICYCFSVIENLNLLFILIADLYSLVVKERRVISLLAIRIPYITEKARGHKIYPNKSDNSSVYRISHSHGQSTLYRKHLDHCLLALS